MRMIISAGNSVIDKYGLLSWCSLEVIKLIAWQMKYNFIYFGDHCPHLEEYEDDDGNLQWNIWNYTSSAVLGFINLGIR